MVHKSCRSTLQENLSTLCVVVNIRMTEDLLRKIGNVLQSRHQYYSIYHGNRLHRQQWIIGCCPIFTNIASILVNIGEIFTQERLLPGYLLYGKICVIVITKAGQITGFVVLVWKNPSRQRHESNTCTSSSVMHNESRYFQ